MKGLATLGFENDRIAAVDKAKGSAIEDTFTYRDLTRIQDAFLPKSDDPAAGRALSLAAAFSHRAAFLLSYHGALRCESTRHLDFSDLATIFAENEGLKGSHLLLLTLGKGKTNRFGKYDRTALMRSKNVEMCAHGALALLLFIRHHVRGAPQISFELNEH